MAIINYMGLIGLQKKADKWHAETKGEHGPKYARVLARAIVSAWNIYYFLRTLEHSLSNNGSLPPALFSKALGHFQEHLRSNPDMALPSHVLIGNLVVTMEDQLMEKF